MDFFIFDMLNMLKMLNKKPKNSEAFLRSLKRVQNKFQRVSLLRSTEVRADT